MKTGSIFVILVSILAQKLCPGVRRTNQLQLSHDPNHWCAEMRTQESKALTLGETIRQEKIIAHSPCPKLHTYCGSKHRDSMMKHQNKESRIKDKASPQQWVFNRARSSESSQKPGSPEQKAEMCNSKPHRRESYFQRALYYKKHKSQRMCKIHSMRLVSSLLGKLLFSSLFPAYC